ncbi:hypothetical protein [Phyllobacterium endophyticum]|uniref:hypothetical protein n=1 Tax=Phyllobacterium endophyticum TaxID=1149773 RepID=UPI00165082EB|nr:hypothetical protein [Phyllobacterium endophyticum]
MKSFSKAITTTIAGTKPGDLIKIGVGDTGVFAIALDKEPNNDTVVGFLQSF